MDPEFTVGVYVVCPECNQDGMVLSHTGPFAERIANAYRRARERQLDLALGPMPDVFLPGTQARCSQCGKDLGEIPLVPFPDLDPESPLCQQSDRTMRATVGLLEYVLSSPEAMNVLMRDTNKLND